MNEVPAISHWLVINCVTVIIIGNSAFWLLHGFMIPKIAIVVPRKQARAQASRKAVS